MRRAENWHMINKGVIISLFTFFIVVYGYGQSPQDSILREKITFISPVDHTIKMAGSFGELRANHFHAGIDIKSNSGTEGDTIRASAKGFISRIKVDRSGYGQVLYMDHPNGYTSVYAHLKSFEDKLNTYILEKQFEHNSYEIDLYPEPNRFSFKQGEVLGLMGNTGRSTGPHLHFEIRKTDTEIPENPYLHNIGPEDSKPPLLYSVEAHGLNNEHQKTWSKSQYVNPTQNGQYGPSVTFEIPAWRAGVAIQTFDQMDGSSNKNGIYSIEMFVDDSLYYSHVMDRVGFDVSHYINSHVDYEEKKKNNRSMTKCYVSPGNPLTFYPNLLNRGEIGLYKEVPRKVDFFIRDFKGNTTTYTCYLLRKSENGDAPKSAIFQKHLKHGVRSIFNLGSCRFDFPALSLDKNCYLKYEEKFISGLLSFSINDQTQALFDMPLVYIPLQGIDTSLLDKIILLYDGKDSYGGQIIGDTLQVRFENFGNYVLAIDTVPPKIVAKSFLKNAANLNQFRFEIFDNYEAQGMASDIKYAVFIDGEWVVAPFKSMDNMLTVPISKLKKGKHTIKIRVEDYSKNVRVWESDFNTSL